MGAEIRVNSYQSNWQREPNILAMADGGFLVVWESDFNNYNDGPVTTYIAGQRFNAAGQAVGGKIVLDAVTGANSGSPRATLLADGGFVLAWKFDIYDAILTMKTKVYTQVFNADGSARTAALQVDTVASNNAVLPDAVAHVNGSFSVVFGVTRSTSLFDQIYVRSTTLTNGTALTMWNSEGSFEIPGSSLDSNELRADSSMGWNIGTVGLNNGAGYDVAAL